jgi:hypothetical protein
MNCRTLTEANDLIDRLLPPMPGWCTPEKGRRMARLVYESQARICVELGVFGGRSLLALAAGLAVDTEGHVWGADPYDRAASLEGTNAPENNEWWGNLDHAAIEKAAREAIGASGLQRFVSLEKCKSMDDAFMAKFPIGTVDVLHQDANHSEETSAAEVRVWAPKIRLGGYWISDDIDWATTKAAQNLLDALGFKLLEDHGSWAIRQRVGSSL